MNNTIGSNARPDDAAPSGSTLPIRFTASGSEYFRIWIVNLLLTLVTVGLYYPWAKVRKLRYFYGNTWVGHHAFDFHGNPRRMLRGTLLVGVLFIAYSAAGQFSPTAGLVAILIIAGVWPALFRASMRFRLANTSWRGMRFHFNGDMAGAYKALLPTMVPAALFIGLTLFMPGAPAEDAAPAASPASWLEALLGVAMLATLALVPLLVWGVKRYQHGHCALGQVQTRLAAGPGPFYVVFAKAAGVSLLSVLGFCAAGFVAAMLLGLGGYFSGEGGKNPGMHAAMVIGMGVFALAYVVLLIVNNTFLTSRLQNLVWNRTTSTEVRFESRLLLGPLVRLALQNGLLVLLTLGLYWPFAAVASARLRLQAVTVHTRRPVDDLAAQAGLAGDNDATGDAAGDLFGLDFGL
ncbi:YjgN family protein [Rhizobacter sp. Root1221]|uniref:YjgN family protein n=1 Tax=Rhizobacter sp. Root1221 TaxID=1736433 RepID=UPI0006F95E28|nr:YjgN family protein [Rhizobacter sp. Root1221]KQW00085.1 hypothetical protein ASC87_18870 [Rhizobacter sp. Root1221]